MCPCHGSPVRTSNRDEIQSGSGQVGAKLTPPEVICSFASVSY